MSFIYGINYGRPSDNSLVTKKYVDFGTNDIGGLRNIEHERLLEEIIRDVKWDSGEFESYNDELKKYLL